MKGFLVRVGIDQAYGQWNAPVDADTGQFVYVPIPEKLGTQFHSGLARSYSEVLSPLNDFCAAHNCSLDDDLKLPPQLMYYHMHLDPDFDTLTYGDQGSRRGARMKEMKEGDLLAFYAGLRSIQPSKNNLIYALVGLFIVEEVVLASNVPKKKWGENAHTRKLSPGSQDIVVRAKRGVSGRLKRCIPIGEWRDRAYRVRPEILDAWGGLSVKDGYIQRSAVPPKFLYPKRFYRWFLRQKVAFIKGSN